MQQRKVVFIAGVLLLAIMVAGCVGPDSVSTGPAPTTGSDQTAPPEEEAGSDLVTAGMNEALVVTSGQKTFEITVLEVIRGRQANNLIQEGNMFNSEPDAGFEYLLVKVRKRFASGDGSEYTSSYEYQVYVEGAGNGPSFVVLPRTHADYKGTTLIRGGSAEGWLVFQVPVGKEAMLAYTSLFGGPAGFIRLS
ncbi:hypothetical protein RJ53_09380 [Methanocalculus chunghsingensis]|uniref:DUF4352 domain-containing protein n=1 Tax=Methanocalculus chunghsingensis TaxID=156457 RepID=A0A8J7W794_9EURY|nr:hypothetical protein [Methanocalculus chunghsingensis]MBR1369674.1 hypothetical protein [Methanocalculus chunghsingensis]